MLVCFKCNNEQAGQVWVKIEVRNVSGGSYVCMVES